MVTTATQRATQTTAFTTPHADLSAAVAAAGLAVSVRPTTAPVMSGLLVEVRGGDIALTGSDGSSFVTVTLPGTASGPDMRALLRYSEVTKLLTAMVKGIPKAAAGQQAVKVDLGGPTATTVTVNGYQVPLTTLPAEDYPALPPTFPIAAEVATDALASAGQRVTSARGKGELAVIHVVVDDGQVRWECTDRVRLTRAILPAVTSVDAGVDVLVPGTILDRVLKHMPGERVTIGVGTHNDQRMIALTSGSVRLVAATSPTAFPPVSEGMPTQRSATATLDRQKTLIAAQRCAAIVDAKDSFPELTVEVAAGAVRIVPKLPEQGDLVAVPALPATVTGAGRVVFRARYLVDALRNFSGASVAIHLQANPAKPVTFTALAEDFADPNAYRHVLMPVRTTF